MKRMKRKPSHPGCILREDYIKPLAITVTEMAFQLGVSRKTLSKILNEKGSVTPDMALRLSRALNTTPELWVNLQKTFDLWEAENSSTDWRRVRSLTENVLSPGRL
ncbi:Plasmid maintenance system antidote protein, XRE family [Candidatus Desulfarcum epimagneticum]|uniref:Plasmid maintenance system antidote protein, XRE family n=1 Tax=uncultured Desulfobacteraceae bacterium TaxID=218296 RepID=A0A484HIH2_9BACT|nr:Plasmid maintenance system antidote protein, XRE family [uncultured Desulfobacteraceae bacterium]